MTNINEFKETAGKYIYALFCNLDVLERKLHAHDLERGALEAYSNQPLLSGSALETLIKNNLGYVHTLFCHASDLFEFISGQQNPVSLPKQKTPSKPNESMSIQDMMVYYYELAEKLHVIFWNMAICFGGQVADKLQDSNTTEKMIAPKSATIILLMREILHELMTSVNISYVIGSFLNPEEDEEQEKAEEDRLDAC